MRQFFISLLGSIVGFFVALFLMFIFFAMIIGLAVQSASSQKTKPKGGIILNMDLRVPMRDHGNSNPLFGGNAPTLINTVRTLHRAKSDDKVKGLFLRANGWGMSPSTAEELRLAIKDFQSSGKFVIAWAQGFEGTSFSGYHGVSTADEIWLQDTTGFALSGYRAEIEFLGGVLDKFDAKPEFIKFHEYKNAVNTYTETTLTPAHKESMTSLLQSLSDTTLDQIANDRNMSTNQLVDFFAGSPYSAEQAKEFGLIDKLGHYAAAREYAKEKAGKGSSFQDITDYGTGINLSGPVIAFVGGQGTILPGNSSDGSNPFSNNVTMGGDTVSKALMKAAKDKNVKAIVFRVNSPGGSPAASDQIWDAVRRAKEEGKPVVVSMGQYAASGGYYVAANADRIVAMPMTITGSIGVFGGKVVLKDTLAKIGYNIEAINTGGEYASVHSAFEPWSASNREGYRRSLESIYKDFTSRVAEGRNLPLERVLEIAKGRVWTGAQAKEIGLVDELGGFMKALNVAKELADIDADKDVRIKIFPRALTTQEQLEQILNVSAEAAASLDELRVLAQTPEFKALISARETLQNSQDMQLQAYIPDIQ
ncbi:MAG TPA: signal peptide peptidase SppA [Hellea balneolensis]|uniref:Signal peptide peptidase SppA n=1 Tax=Hellea balneolensis TaxID=287478 RepID=A0A7C3GLW6_9PROT|nr:signal peptide peptidase SppA [Hellea balneolensis]